jgi:hypothetical protein
VVGATLAAADPAQTARPAQAASAGQHAAINCEYSSLCAEVANPADVFGAEYVGHDEPSAVFYSNTPGSGNHRTYSMRLPRDPSPASPNTPGKSYQFQLNGSIWLGMALCATQSYPEQVSTCAPDSDSNIVDPAVSPNHPGTAFVELQFYPPGWVPWPTWQVAVGASACDPTKWCAAMNIFSLAGDPVNGTVLNSTCAAKTGLEYVNYAFVTKNGRPTATPNPVQSTTATFTPGPKKDLFMNSGDNLSVSLRDTPHGLQAVINDLTSGQRGSMTASAATPFGLDPSGNPVTCPAGNTEGFGDHVSPTDGDDDFCFPASEALRIHINGCTDTNTGFDSLGYQPVWPDGNTALHPQPILFSSPRTGPGDRVNYSRVAFEADLPRIEFNTCNRSSGAGCTLIPTTDKGTPAAFYPFFSAFQHGIGRGHDHGGCAWGSAATCPARPPTSAATRNTVRCGGDAGRHRRRRPPNTLMTTHLAG